MPNRQFIVVFFANLRFHFLTLLHVQLLIQLIQYAAYFNGRVSDKPHRLTRHQRAQAHNSTLTVVSTVLFTGYVCT
jgi:hypothetical protein